MVLNGQRKSPAVARRVRLGAKPDARGGLLIVEEPAHLPFTVSQVEWIAPTTGGIGEVAFEADREHLVFPLRGAMDVEFPHESRPTVTLSDPTEALAIPAGMASRLRIPQTSTACVVTGAAAAASWTDGSKPAPPEMLAVRGCALRPLAVTTAGGLTRVRVDVERDLPFQVRRIYALHSVQAGVRRGGHAHRALRQLLVAARGRLDLAIDDGTRKDRIRLDDPARGILIEDVVWRELEAFSPDAVCLVLCSAPYDEADYIRDYAIFRRSVP